MCQMVEQVPTGIHTVEGEDEGVKQNIWDVAEQGVFRINLQLLP